MKITKTNLITEAIFSEDRTKRYLLHKTWDETKPSLCIILLAPSEADLITLDNTTQLVLNNAVRLGYGGVYIWNLFSRLNDFHLRNVDPEDPENLQVLRMILDKVDTVVYAPGVGKAKNQYFLARQEQVVNELQPYESKLKCLCDAEGKARLQHPLSPAVRVWFLSELSLQELSSETEKSAEKKESRRGRPKKVQQAGTPSEG